MRIVIFGSNGEVGRRVVAEALSRGHKVTAIIRNNAQFSQLPKEANILIGNAENMEEIAQSIKDQDLIISAVRPAEGHEDLLPILTKSILDNAAKLNIRALIVGGAASLQMPGEDNVTVLTAPGFLPDSVIPIAQACQKQYELCIANKDANWTYVSPPAMLAAGTRTGNYRLGTDELIQDKQGISTISMEDFVVALLDEAEQVKHQKIRFTVAY